MKSLNPAYKMLSVIVASLILSTTFHIRVNLVVAVACLLVTFLTPGINRKGLLLAMVPFGIAALGMFTTGLFFGDHGTTAGVEVSAFGPENTVCQQYADGHAAGKPYSGLRGTWYAVCVYHGCL